MMKISFAIILLVLFAMGCNNLKNDKQAYKDQTQQESYYKRIPDAPLDFYCYLNETIGDTLRDSLCKHVMFELSGNLSIDMGIVIRNNMIDTVEIDALSFDEQGNSKYDTLSFNLLKELFNKVDLQQIPTMKNLIKEDFALRVQFERFCSGYITIHEPEIAPFIKSVQEKESGQNN